MSYSYQVKKSLIAEKKHFCCQKAELYGFLCFCNTFTQQKIRIVLEHKSILDYFIAQIQKICQIRLSEEEIRISGCRQIKYQLDLVDPILLDKLRNVLGYQQWDQIDTTILESDCCRGSFVRGAFIASGFLSDPAKNYSLELVLPRPEYKTVMVSLFESVGIHGRVSIRKNSPVVYLKSADDIKNFLTWIGAKEFVFDYIHAEIEKNIRNEINRVMNCENANMNKMILASERQAMAIQKLKDRGFVGLDPSLVEIAQARLLHRDYSLEQLGQSLKKPLSKSGVSHRLKKIMELAERLDK